LSPMTRYRLKAGSSARLFLCFLRHLHPYHDECHKTWLFQNPGVHLGL
jgi:hypothetical protein